MSRRSETNAAIQAKIIAALTDEWQRSTAVCVAIYGPAVEYGKQAYLYYHFRKMAGANLIEHDNRRGDAGERSRRVNFYRRVQANG